MALGGGPLDCHEKKAKGQRLNPIVESHVYLDLLKMVGKKQMVVKNGDESHGIKSVKKSHKKQTNIYDFPFFLQVFRHHVQLSMMNFHISFHESPRDLSIPGFPTIKLFGERCVRGHLTHP